MLKATDKLMDKISRIPEQPGIYKMLDSHGNIIYVGKSKCLKKRVKSYFTSNPKWEKVKKMVSFINDIEIIVTDTHLEARLLECELIKSLKPVFNAQMKHDRGYVYLQVGENHRYNPLSVIKERESNTFGPFRSRFMLMELAAMLKNIYPLVKKDRYYEFDYHLITAELNKASFTETRNILIELLSDDDNITCFIHEAETKMQEAASSYQYETAARYRDIIAGMTIIKYGINGYRNLSVRDIVLKLPIADGYKLFFISRGAIKLKKPFNDLSDHDINGFIAEGIEAQPQYELDMDEKSAIDFRDIIYSEILTLPEDNVLFV